MTGRPAPCFRGQRLVTAVRIIHEDRLAGVPVFDSKFRLVGVLSLDDVVRWEAGRNDSRRWLRTIEQPALVAHAMTHDVTGVFASESVSDAARVMRFVSRSVLPVLNEGGSLAGMISAREIVSAVGRSDSAIRCEVIDHLDGPGGTAEHGSINVRVENGTVILPGATASSRSLARLQHSVASVTGVIGIKTDHAVAVVSQPE